MKKTLIIITTLLLALVAFGCMSPEEKAAQNEIVTYLDNMTAIETQKNEITKNFMIIENSNDDEEILAILSDTMVPTSAEINKKLEEIPITNQKLKKAHQYFIDGWGQLNQGLIDLEKGLSEKDVSLAEKGSLAVDKSQTALNEYYKELKTLCDQYKIKLKTETETPANVE